MNQPKLKKSDLVVVSKEEAYWTVVRDMTKIQVGDLNRRIIAKEGALDDLKKGLKLQVALLGMSEDRIKKEKT